MATLRGSAVTAVSLSESTTSWEGFNTKGSVGAPLPHPDPLQNVGVIGLAQFTQTPRRQAPSVISVVSNSQAANRGDREANLGPAPIDGMGVGFDWFEEIHPDPQRLDLGNVVDNVTVLLDLYNAYRIDSRLWTVFVNNAGDGITLANLPTLPKEIPPQTSFTAEVQVASDGPPTIDGTLDFTFDVTSVSVPITGTRVILFGLIPSGGTVNERLSWLTNVMKAADGTEQRAAVRQFPRQQISFQAITQRDIDRNELNAFLFDWHSRVFGVPLWWDARLVNADVVVGATSISVVSTEWADFRIDGLAAVIAFDADGNRTADTLKILSVSASPSVVTFTGGTLNAYTSGQALLIPVVPGILGAEIPKSRVPTTAQTTQVSFTALDDEKTSLVADTSGFNSFNGKAVVDDKNSMNRELSESYTMKITRLDGETGEILQSTTEDRSTPTSNKRWNAETAQRRWEIKSLLYALRGQQVSFFMPTFNKDMAITAAVGIGATTINIENIGYTRFIKAREPFTTIAVRLKSGAGTFPSPMVPLGSPNYWVPGQEYMFFDIASSVELTATEEQITISPPVPVGFSSDDIDRIEFITKSRFSSDAVELIHKWNDALGEEIDSQIDVPLTGIYDEGIPGAEILEFVQPIVPPLMP